MVRLSPRLSPPRAADRPGCRTRHHPAVLAAALAIVALGGTACSDGGARSGSAAEPDAAARTAAEAFRSALLADDGPDGRDRRSRAVLEAAAGDLPGHPEVRGIEDADGDGFDDDGRIELRVEGRRWCLLVDDAGDTDVERC